MIKDIEKNNENVAINDKEIAVLKEHFSACFKKDGSFDLERFKEELKDKVDIVHEGYELKFLGKSYAKLLASIDTTTVITPNTEHNNLPENSNSENIYISGDNLDGLKHLLKSYSKEVKCIYIDPPYNTGSEGFVYKDNFNFTAEKLQDKLSIDETQANRIIDLTKRNSASHSAWLMFMYSRLQLAKDLLKDDGVMFISIDDKEQSNLKLLCDDIFGEENFLANFNIKANPRGRQSDSNIATLHDYLLCYGKSKDFVELNGIALTEEDIEEFDQFDEDGKAWRELGLRQRGSASLRVDRPDMFFPIYVNPEDLSVSLEKSDLHFVPVVPKKSTGVEGRWMWGFDKVKRDNSRIFARLIKRRNEYDIFIKDYLERNDEIRTKKPKSIWHEKDVNTEAGGKLVKSLFETSVFSYPKPIGLLKRIIALNTNSNEIILDFFAGSGTTGHAVMQLNADDGGSRKFILCQIDEPIDLVKKKEAYNFCIKNNLPPVISSLTIERLKRAGAKISINVEEENLKAGIFEEDKKQVPDIGYKVFDSVEAPQLKVDETGQIAFPEIHTDALSRIYNMVFTIGLDEPTQVPEVIVKDSIYKIGNHYYITNSEKITSEDYSNVLKNGKVFIDGWTASLNGTLQNYKEEVKIVF